MYALAQTSFFKELLKGKFEQTDFNSLKSDIIPFVNTDYNIDNLNKEMFISSLEYLGVE